MYKLIRFFFWHSNIFSSVLRNKTTVKTYFIKGKDQTFLEFNVNGSIGACELSQQNQQVLPVFRAKL